MAALTVASGQAQATTYQVTPASPKVAGTPKVTVTVDPNAKLAPGLFFAGPKYDLGAKPANATIGPEILDANGHAVYFVKTGSVGVRATDVREQSYHGAPVLTYWQGGTPKGPDGQLITGVGSGSDYILSQRYHVLKTVHGHGLEDGVPIKADQHEFLLTKHNTALIVCYGVTRRDATAEGGAKNQAVLDGIVEEIDLATSKVVFQWHSINHVPLSRSHTKPTANAPDTPWDYFHINAAKLDTDGNVIVSGRHTWAVYKINHNTGRTMWQFGGKASNFAIPKADRFAWQHDPEPMGNNTYRIFDNHWNQVPPQPAADNHSRVITLALNFATHTASKVTEVDHHPNVFAGSQGNSQTQPAGHLVVGWGATSQLSEYNAKHQQVWNAQFDNGYNTYRAYKSPWVGNPDGHPSLTFKGSGSNRQVDVVWNGASRVHKWRIMGGSTRGNVVTIASTPWSGLDTAFKLSSYPKFLRIGAVDAHGHVLGYTNTKST
jgi:hypothetical protein